MLQLKVKDIEGANFTAVLDLCFKYSTYFSLTENGCGHMEDESHVDFLKQLSEFHVKTIETEHWFRFYMPKGQRKVYLYKADKKAQTIIQSHFDNLYLGYIDCKEYTKNLPEDLCFFVEDKLFVGTLSHAGICNVYPFSETVKKEIMSLAKWKSIEFDYNEQIILDLNE